MTYRNPEGSGSFFDDMRKQFAEESKTGPKEVYTSMNDGSDPRFPPIFRDGTSEEDKVAYYEKFVWPTNPGAEIK